MHRDLSILKAEMFVQLVATTMHPGERTTFRRKPCASPNRCGVHDGIGQSSLTSSRNVIGIRSIENFDGSLSLSLFTGLLNVRSELGRTARNLQGEIRCSLHIPRRPSLRWLPTNTAGCAAS